MIINCIGDITGYGKTLVELYNQLPTGELWALGDIVDRGPNSKLALDFLIDGGHNAVMGNHDHMMLFERIQEEKDVNSHLYHPDDWIENGGQATLASFNVRRPEFAFNSDYDKYFNWIKSLPLFQYRGDGPVVLQMTHAPLVNNYDPSVYDLDIINKDFAKWRESTLWNRFKPHKIKNVFQIYGHNSPRGILWHSDQYPMGIYSEGNIPKNAWGACIDTWREGYLTALSIDTDKLETPETAITVYTQKIVD